jgi:hypothetical protein
MIPMMLRFIPIDSWLLVPVTILFILFVCQPCCISFTIVIPIHHFHSTTPDWFHHYHHHRHHYHHHHHGIKIDMMPMMTTMTAIRATRSILIQRIATTTTTTTTRRNAVILPRHTMNEEEEDDGIGIGIDLGTTNSAVAYWNHTMNAPIMIPIPDSSSTSTSSSSSNSRRTTIPSVVAFKPYSFDLTNDTTMMSHDHFPIIEFDGYHYQILVGYDAIQYENDCRRNNNNNNINNNNDNTNDHTLMFEHNEPLIGTNEHHLSNTNYRRRRRSGDVIHPNVYRNVKRIIGTGGQLSSDIIDVVPHVLIHPNGRTYKKRNINNTLYDAQHSPTLLQLFHHHHHHENDDDNDNKNKNNHPHRITIPPEFILYNI